jgi:uncharacterized membrane protein
VVIWVGGMFFMTSVLLPMLQCSTSSQTDVSRIIDRTVKRFQTISWEAVGIITLTGVFNLINVGLENHFNFSAAYLYTVATKLLLLIVIIAIQSFVSYSLFPRLITAASSHDRLRKRAMLLSVPQLALAGSAIYLALSLKYR